MRIFARGGRVRFGRAEGGADTPPPTRRPQAQLSPPWGASHAEGRDGRASPGGPGANETDRGEDQKWRSRSKRRGEPTRVSWTTARIRKWTGEAAKRCRRRARRADDRERNAGKHVEWELDASCAPTAGSSCGPTKTTKRAIWEASGRSPSPDPRMPRESCSRKCACRIRSPLARRVRRTSVDVVLAKLTAVAPSSCMQWYRGQTAQLRHS